MSDPKDRALEAARKLARMQVQRWREGPIQHWLACKVCGVFVVARAPQPESAIRHDSGCAYAAFIREIDLT